MNHNKAAILEVVIPTYNRPSALRRTVAALLPQLKEGVRIRIIDNASDYNPVEILGDMLHDASRGPTVLVERNVCNIGLAGNLLRCFERANAEWMYLLGDDDCVLPDLVQIALRTADDHKDVDQVNFSSFFVRTTTSTCRGLEDALQSLDSYANWNFISANMYRVSSFQRHLRIGYDFAGSLSPHIALSLSCLAMGGSIVYSSDKPVDRAEVEDGQHWDWTIFCLRQGLLAEHPALNDSLRLLLMGKIEGSAKVLEKTTVALLRRAGKAGHRVESQFLYDCFAQRWFYFTASISQRVKLRFYRLLFVSPSVSLAVILAGLRIMGRRDKVDEYLRPPTGEGRL
jgi:glycosyltransferase involved in cell wall biosynthesis